MFQEINEHILQEINEHITLKFHEIRKDINWNTLWHYGNINRFNFFDV